MKNTKWLVHAIALCSDCNFSDDDYIIAQESGRSHNLKTGFNQKNSVEFVKLLNLNKLIWSKKETQK